ncbi:hypothetical protein AVEN_200330-1 [Araneus ventricosus]|uniref:Uncharacterized protein n=1 Tax=Araneus ventricosus TaxID=182803 RepID=A0A4Y2GT33_ARAVE|nr:hypothetical protein AVEN_200330-1 [Araneus ventricosus]
MERVYCSGCPRTPYIHNGRFQNMHFFLCVTAVFFVFGRLCGKMEDIIEQRDAAVGRFDYYWDVFGVGGHCTWRRRKCKGLLFCRVKREQRISNFRCITTYKYLSKFCFE